MTAGGVTTTEEAASRPPVDPRRGLTAAEVAERVARGEVNAAPPSPSRTFGEILRANLFTRFNALMVSLGAVVLAAGAPGDALFLGVVIANTLIGVLQEVRAKRTLDRLALLNAPRARVVRDGTTTELPVEDLVLDDVIELAPGQQVVADAVAVASDNLEIDESLLTGEADAVDKPVGAELLSGSFVVAGAGRAQVVRVGADAYAARLAGEARRFSLTKSLLMRDVNRIVQLVTWLLVPIGLLLAVTQLVVRDEPWQEAAVSAVAGVIGMVPEGLILLTSVAFAVGAIRLAQRRALVNELPAVEVLARVDVLCVDKTGTITAGALDLAEVRSLGGTDLPVADALAAVAASDPNPNPTQAAIEAAYPVAPAGWELVRAVPFSSARKWTAAAFQGRGTWVLGAPEFVLGNRYDEVRPVVEPEADAGMRVLLLAHSPDALDGEALPATVTPAALVLLEDRLRPDAAETFTYFARQGVTIKVISGDNPRTVAAVATRAKIAGAARSMDARDLPDPDADPEAFADALHTFTVFGRVTPHQKRAMVGALQSRGHTVAMTGDGVNDVLALKASDCGIAMASGSEATRAVAQVVLLDSQFSVMPRVVAEGRQVINNIERVASLFLTKTAYSTILAVLTGVLLLPYPFLPRHITVIGSLTIGIPAFFLALAPNDALVRHGFLRRVLAVAIPGGIAVAVLTMTAYGLARMFDASDLEADRTVAVIVAFGVAFQVLVRAARPLVPWKLGMLGALVGVFALALAVPWLGHILELETPRDWREWVVIATLVALAWPMLLVGDRLASRWRFDPDPPG